jgi:hypothetical protein
MAILRCGESLRLSGKDAEDYLRDTNCKVLPTSIFEYNKAMASIRAKWQLQDTPEAKLIVAACFQDIKPI